MIEQADFCDQFLSTFNRLTKDNTIFLRCKDKNIPNDLLQLTKSLYDKTKEISENEHRNKASSSKLYVSSSLARLHINKFDDEQIWQEMELENVDMIRQMVAKVSKITAKKDRLTLGVEEETNHFAVSENGKSNQVEVHDRFFKLSELEKFLDEEDKREERARDNQTNDNEDEEDEDEDEEDLDYFLHVSSSDEDEDEKIMSNAKYGDFFDPPENESNRVLNDDEDEEAEGEGLDADIDTRDVDASQFETDDWGRHSNDEENDDDEDLINSHIDFNNFDDEDDEDEDDEDNEKSAYEKQQQALRNKITRLEKLSLDRKPWQLKGEIQGEVRPENSLLEEHLQFDHVSKPAPVITEETTHQVENLIKKRIKEACWDDVERKVKPNERPFEYKRRIELDQQKAKASLATIYEQEYLKQNQDKKTEQENQEHVQIKKLMRGLFLQLDALSNFNFTPRPPQSEVRIINNLPAVSVEEATPAMTSDASLLAPQEVFNKPNRELLSKEEKTKTDKLRSRRIKKKVQGIKRKHNEEKEKIKKKKSEVKVKESENVTLMEDQVHDSSGNNKSLKSSKQFFATLQDQVDKKNSVKVKKLKPTHNSKKLKL